MYNLKIAIVLNTKLSGFLSLVPIKIAESFQFHMENFFAYFYPPPKKKCSEFLVEQRAKSSEQRAESNKQWAKNSEQRAESNKQWAKSNEQRAKTKEQRAKTNKQRATSQKFHLIPLWLISKLKVPLKWSSLLITCS